MSEKHGEDVVDVRDLCERVEELESMTDEDDDGNTASTRDEDEEKELTALQSLLEDLRGNGGDHQWRGDWYPVTLIRDDHFEEYAQQFAEDIGAIKDDMSWPYNCIDWERAASDLQQDYSSVDWDGITYWYR